VFSLMSQSCVNESQASSLAFCGGIATNDKAVSHTSLVECSHAWMYGMRTALW
jgi:hypothetical protein